MTGAGFKSFCLAQRQSKHLQAILTMLLLAADPNLRSPFVIGLQLSENLRN